MRVVRVALPGVAFATALGASGCTGPAGDCAARRIGEGDRVAALNARVAQLGRRLPAPDLGQQMLELQLRHDRLWWARTAGNWNLAFHMVRELGETLGGIAKTNGDAPQLQPERLSEMMPAIMDPAISRLQDALAKHGTMESARAYNGLSSACNASHAAAGVELLHIQRPRTPLLDNLRYEPPHPAGEPRIGARYIRNTP